MNNGCMMLKNYASIKDLLKGQDRPGDLTLTKHIRYTDMAF